jgi:hypothetical protein
MTERDHGQTITCPLAKLVWRWRTRTDVARRAHLQEGANGASEAPKFLRGWNSLGNGIRYLNSLTAIRVLAGTKNSRPVGFYSRNSTKSTVNPNTTIPQI